MQLHPQDRTVAVLDSMTEAACLRPASAFQKAAWPVFGYRGAVFRSSAVTALVNAFDTEQAGFDTIRNRWSGPRHTVSAQCRNGLVGEISHKISGTPVAAGDYRASLLYLRDVFQSYADIVTPAFGDDFRIRLEDRTGRFAFHHDDRIMVATLGLDKDHTPTLWKNRFHKTVSGNPGDVTIVTPPLLHSSPDVPMRPVLSASTVWVPAGRA